MTPNFDPESGSEIPTHNEDIEVVSPRMQPQASRIIVSGLGSSNVPSAEITTAPNGAINQKGVVSPAKKED
jgi:hypothetical protein